MGAAWACALRQRAGCDQARPLGCMPCGWWAANGRPPSAAPSPPCQARSPACQAARLGLSAAAMAAPPCSCLLYWLRLNQHGAEAAGPPPSEPWEAGWQSVAAVHSFIADQNTGVDCLPCIRLLSGAGVACAGPQPAFSRRALSPCLAYLCTVGAGCGTLARWHGARDAAAWGRSRTPRRCLAHGTIGRQRCSPLHNLLLATPRRLALLPLVRPRAVRRAFGEPVGMAGRPGGTPEVESPSGPASASRWALLAQHGALGQSCCPPLPCAPAPAAGATAREAAAQRNQGGRDPHPEPPGSGAAAPPPFALPSAARCAVWLVGGPPSNRHPSWRLCLCGAAPARPLCHAATVRCSRRHSAAEGTA